MKNNIYDAETDLYYLQSRYYDAEVGRFISAEPNLYIGGFDSASRFAGYNVYVYCANNPINFSDPTGEFILTAIIVGAITGAIIGGTIGGVASYNSAKESGEQGADLFFSTFLGTIKGAVIGGVAGAIVGGTSGVLAQYGVASTIGGAVLTGGATIFANATDVSVLQVRKSSYDGDSGWQKANDCVNAIFNNGVKIILPIGMKTGTTFGSYVWTDIAKHKVVPLKANDFFSKKTNSAFAWGFVGIAWGKVIQSIYTKDIYETAESRGYHLE